MVIQSATMSKRIFATVPDDVYEKFIGWCGKLALQQSQLGGMAIQAGLDNIVRAVAPAESMTPAQWAAIAAAMVKSGQPITLPDGTVVGAEDVPAKSKRASKTATKKVRKHAETKKAV